MIQRLFVYGTLAPGRPNEHVLSSEELDGHWKRLDDFEGKGYERDLTPVRLRSGETVEASVYPLRRT